MKRLYLLILMTFITPAFSQLVGTAFNYQGELLDNGSPANGEYDFIFDLYSSEIPASPGNLLSTFSTNNVMVVNGLFNVDDLDFGSVFQSGVEAWIEVSVKKSTDINFDILVGRQRLNAVPYSYKSEVSGFSSIADHALVASQATSLNISGATLDDILKFDGSQWQPATPYWLKQNNILFTSDNNSSNQIVMGQTLPNSSAKLTVNQAQSGINTQFIGHNGMFNEFVEDGIPRGYIGSVQNGSNTGTTNEDFEVGTAVANSGSFHLTTEAVPRLTITNLGRVGIANSQPTNPFQVGTDSLVVTRQGNVGVGAIGPSSKLQVSSSSAQNVTGALRVRIDNLTKLDVRNDELYIGQDVKHSNLINGLMKYMVKARCMGSGSSILSYYNAVNSLPVTITDTGTTGNCWIDFPTDINNRYWQVSAVSSSGRHVANCSIITTNDKLLCQRTLSDVINDGDIMILVY